MTTYAAVMVAALWSVTFGYEPSADADEGYDYIVQVEPAALEALQHGEVPEIEANLPPEVNPVRRVRIVVGNQPLPKKLRAPVAREVRRPEVETDSSTLLAQTGPAGGFGRHAIGFQNGPAGSSANSAAANTTPSTVTPPGTTYRPFQYANPSSSAAGGNASSSGYPVDPGTPAVGTTSLREGQPRVGDQLGQVRDNLREATNNIGQAGQQVIDTTRQVMSDVIAPPTNPGFDAQGRPLANVAERLQSEVRNTAEALREPWERATQGNLSNSSGAAATSNAQVGPPAEQSRSFDSWAPTSTVNNGVSSGAAPGVSHQPQNAPNQDRYAQERSVLNQGGQGQDASTQGSASQRERQPPLLEAPNNQQQGAYAPSQNRNPVDLYDWSRTRGPGAETQQPENPSQPTSSGNVANDLNRGFENSSGRLGQGQQPTGSLPRGNDWQGNDYDSVRQSPQQPQATPPQETPGVGVTLTSENAGSPRRPASDSSGLEEFGGNGSGGNVSRDQAFEDEPSSASSGVTALNVLAWAVAVGSIFGNLFQWGSIVDLRNKYRVALRRNSPGFGRSMAA